MKTLKLISAIALLWAGCFQVGAQAISIRDIWAEGFNRSIAVHYSLAVERPVNLSLKFSIDNGNTWFDCNTISGDVYSQNTGNKTIIWNCIQDGWEKGSSFLFKIDAIDQEKEEKALAEQRAKEDKLLAEQKAKEDKLLAEQKAKEDKLIAEQRAKEKLRIADSLKTERKKTIIEDRKLANQNLNGNYISFGSGLLSSGYYGCIGIGYEYRYHILGVNFAIGLGYEPLKKGKPVGNIKYTYYSTPQYLNMNAGIKLYLANKINFIRSLYFNILPFCYFGQDMEYINEYSLGKNGNSIMVIEGVKFPHLYCMGLFLGYSPVWHVSKNVAMGFNIDMGLKANYKLKKWCLNWDFGIVLKIDNKNKN